ncbi:SDR family NAD(P)-dependent oxidoreductase [Nocardia sp. BMG51109]|uniref:SDR family NAD(P)-dependent oxidoreductase n=1 Tax=Nocardia sp. BMG51109 TaxID=1056816 RepID=UPI0004ADE3DE|nr:SDR family NAD(P)-dependent oxidoreductase [Nocardia sp. BMG51109]
MPRTYVITGGTDGIGAAVARTLFRRGDHVVVIGTDPAEAARLAREAHDSTGSADFLPADLSLVSDTQRVVRALTESYAVIDGVILCARYFQTYRRQTPEGFEHNFALFYLSRVLISYGLVPALEKSDHPVVVNVAGPGNDTPIDWDDLQCARNYNGVHTMFVTGRYNDLLGVAFAQHHGTGPIRYVLFHPLTTSCRHSSRFSTNLPPSRSARSTCTRESAPRTTSSRSSRLLGSPRQRRTRWATSNNRRPCGHSLATEVCRLDVRCHAR